MVSFEAPANETEIVKITLQTNKQLFSQMIPDPIKLEGTVETTPSCHRSLIEANNR
jgi:hypothetical protein